MLPKQCRLRIKSSILESSEAPLEANLDSCSMFLSVVFRYNGKVGYIPTMHLQPSNYPHIRLMPSHQGSRSPSPSLQQQSHQLSHSQGNLLQLPASRSPSPYLQADSRQRSQSLNVLSEQPPALPAASANVGNRAARPAGFKQNPPPMITVEMDGEEEQRGRSPTTDSDSSFGSESTDFSLSDDLSDDLSSSTTSSMFSLRPGGNDERVQLSRTPPPRMNNHLSPTSDTEGKMIPSVSDPNLYKGPMTPKVPPRPRAQEILSRCTSITRKNAARGSPSPTQTEILSR